MSEQQSEFAPVDEEPSLGQSRRPSWEPVRAAKDTFATYDRLTMDPEYYLLLNKLGYAQTIDDRIADMDAELAAQDRREVAGRAFDARSSGELNEPKPLTAPQRILQLLGVHRQA